MYKMKEDIDCMQTTLLITHVPSMYTDKLLTYSQFFLFLFLLYVIRWQDSPSWLGRVQRYIRGPLYRNLILATDHGRLPLPNRLSNVSFTN